MIEVVFGADNIKQILKDQYYTCLFAGVFYIHSPHLCQWDLRCRVQFSDRFIEEQTY